VLKDEAEVWMDVQVGTVVIPSCHRLSMEPKFTKAERIRGVVVRPILFAGGSWTTRICES